MEAGCELMHRNARNKSVAEIVSSSRNMTAERKQLLGKIKVLAKDSKDS